MKTFLVYRRKVFLLAIIYILICLALGLVSTYVLKLKILSIALLLILVLPIILLKQILNFFTRSIFVGLYDDRFVITGSNRSGKSFEDNIKLRDVLSYSIQLPIKNASDIQFNLSNGISYSYSFYQKGNKVGNVSNIELIDSFHLLIKKYNEKKPIENRIILIPSFYASYPGLVVIGLLSTLLIVAIVLISYFKGISSLPFTFIFTILIIFQLLIKRKRESDYYKEAKIKIGG